MSKIIETLKASVMEYKKKDPMPAEDAQKTKSSYQITQEQLADIYFSGSEKIKKSDYPTVIKVSDKNRLSSSAVPWGVALAAVLITGLTLFSTKRIFVDVKIMTERAASLSSPQNILGGAEENSVNSQQTSTSGTKNKKKLLLGDVIPTRDFFFEGASKLKSSKDRTLLTLVNSSVAPFARAVLRFDSPMNFEGYKIIFYAKGSRGGENIAFAMKDKDSVPAFKKNKIYPFPGALTTDWQRAEIPLFNVTNEFDPKNVVSLRFEFGSKDTDNKPGDTIYLKDLQVAPL